MTTLTRCSSGTTTTLHRAAITGDLDAVRAALTDGVPVDAPDPEAYTPLHLAGKHAEPDVFHALLEAGADVEIANVRGMTTLFGVAATGVVSLTRATLARGADVNRIGARGLTPLIAGITSGNPDIVRMLIAHGADVEHRDAAGISVRRWARQLGTREIFEFVRHPERAADTVVDFTASADLHRAARTGDVERIRECLAFGVPVDAPDADDFTALLIASRQQRRAAIAVLLAAGADPYRTTRTGFTPLLFAATNATALRPFIAAGVDLNRLSGRLGIAPLHHAARNGATDAVRCLLAAGADALLPDGDGRRAIDHAEAHGHRRTAMLLQANAVCVG
ncbi:MAG TPA: ankyrin repeat domain-containing protein [Gemmataceae bacterium]|jgi:hypothetical protein|nr:ankyrin repeat domain-containing protein [Gemmataceae bacterium]